MAQIISVYIDSSLRIPSNSVNADYLTKAENVLVQLFRFLQAKEVFIQTYIELLSNRLINCMTNPDREMQLAMKFKVECGDNFM
jgi:hypothetical protein